MGCEGAARAQWGGAPSATIVGHTMTMTVPMELHSDEGTGTSLSDY